MPVACGLWLLCRLFFRVGLKLELCCKSSLLEVLELLRLPVPHRHKALLQPGGRLSLFFRSSNKSCGWWKPSFLKCAQRAVLLALNCTPFFMREISRSRFLMSLLSFLTMATRLLLLVERVVLFNTSFRRNTFSLTAAAAGLSKHPSRVLRYSPSYSS